MDAFDPRPHDLDRLTRQEYERMALIESGWLSFRDQTRQRSYDSAALRERDAFYAGASLVVMMLATLAREPITEAARFQICSKLDEEVREFCENSDYDILFRPYLRP